MSNIALTRANGNNMPDFGQRAKSEPFESSLILSS